MKNCVVVECAAAPRSKGYCARHYARVLRGTNPHAKEYYVGEDDRECKKCEEVKLDTEFSKSARNLRGYTRVCKECKRKEAADRMSSLEYRERERSKRDRSRVLKLYGAEGITLYEKVKSGTASCDSCGTSQGRMCLDHSHTSGKLRGILCHGCNVTLGFMGDDPGKLTNLLAYLFTHESQSFSQSLTYEDTELIELIAEVTE